MYLIFMAAMCTRKSVVAVQQYYSKKIKYLIPCNDFIIFSH